MSEHIKTGQEIWNEINEYSDVFGQHEWSDIRFIPVSWLKEPVISQIEEHLNEIQKGNNICFNAESVRRILKSLLEEK